IVIGNSNVGKSQLLNVFNNNKFSHESKSTIGVEYYEKYYEQNAKTIKLVTWDTAGQEKYQALNTSYYKQTNGCLICYDSTNMESFNAINTWYRGLEPYLDESNPTVVVVVATKCDLKENLAVPFELAEKYATDNNFLFARTSALEKETVDTAFTNLVDKLLTNEAIYAQ
ncbi:MAG: Rab GTPase ypt31, partial [Paramarteilia canceri]